MGKKMTLILFGLFLSMGMALAQNKISGTVFEDNGDPCIGATVMIQGTKQGTKTDLDGHFTIAVPDGKKLVISYVGMTTQTVKAKDGMTVTLQPDAHTVDEVVVTGVVKQDKRLYVRRPAAQLPTVQLPTVQLPAARGQPGPRPGSQLQKSLRLELLRRDVTPAVR